MGVESMKFQRVFSKSMYKSLKLPLGEMTFTKDFVNDKRGDLYPVITKDETCVEKVENNSYTVKHGSVERMFTRFFPYANYEISFTDLGAECGFVFHLEEKKAKLTWNEKEFLFCDGDLEQKVDLIKSFSGGRVIVSCRPGAFDIYIFENGKANYFHTFKTPSFSCSNEKRLFDRGYVSVIASGKILINSVSSYIDCGISQADIRSVCYENGDVIYENGQIFFTASIRMQESSFQGVFSFVPTTSKIELVGALFFDIGDGFWRNYLASSLLFDRNTKKWYIWTSSFEHKHILCYASFEGEPRFGVNVIDVKMMKEAENGDLTDFAGFKGDEDPDFYFDENKGKWIMAICRISPETKSYRYMFFESDDPFCGYKFIGQGCDGAETGGKFVKLQGETVFVCGNAFNKRSNYRIYTKSGMHEAKFDFDDGGFRGWGTIIPLAMGSRKRYFWLTFDRHNGSSYNWSYGNIYCFEAVFI